MKAVIPNPPFKINIEISKEKRIRDQYSFKEIKASSLKDHSWKEDENIHIFEITFDKESSGYKGSAIVAILEKGNMPVESLELTSREIEIEGKTYTLERKLKISENAIHQNLKTLTINESGDVIEDISIEHFAKSKSKISLHGIEIPRSLFPELWIRKKNQVKIAWPFPLLLVVDISGHRDLDLNSSRTEIIFNEKWTDFEQDLAYDVCSEIAGKASLEYWNALKEILLKGSRYEVFLQGLNKVQHRGEAQPPKMG